MSGQTFGGSGHKKMDPWTSLGRIEPLNPSWFRDITKNVQREVLHRNAAQLLKYAKTKSSCLQGVTCLRRSFSK